MLQQKGCFDVILNGDVDTLRFDCNMTWHSWSSNDIEGNRNPTSVEVCNAEIMRRDK